MRHALVFQALDDQFGGRATRLAHTGQPIRASPTPDPRADLRPRAIRLDVRPAVGWEEMMHEAWVAAGEVALEHANQIASPCTPMRGRRGQAGGRSHADDIRANHVATQASLKHAFHGWRSMAGLEHAVDGVGIPAVQVGQRSRSSITPGVAF